MQSKVYNICPQEASSGEVNLKTLSEVEKNDFAARSQRVYSTLTTSPGAMALVCSADLGVENMVKML